MIQHPKLFFLRIWNWHPESISENKKSIIRNRGSRVHRHASIQLDTGRRGRVGEEEKGGEKRAVGRGEERSRGWRTEKKRVVLRGGKRRGQ